MQNSFICRNKQKKNQGIQSCKLNNFYIIKFLLKLQAKQKKNSKNEYYTTPYHKLLLFIIIFYYSQDSFNGWNTPVIKSRATTPISSNLRDSRQNKIHQSLLHWLSDGQVSSLTNMQWLAHYYTTSSLYRYGLTHIWYGNEEKSFIYKTTEELKSDNQMKKVIRMYKLNGMHLYQNVV